MFPILESVPTHVAEPLIGGVKRQVAAFLESKGIRNTTPQFELVLDRTISRGCRREVALIRQGGRGIRSEDTDNIYRSQLQACLDEVFFVFGKSFAGIALDVSSMDRSTVDLGTTVQICDDDGLERPVPAFLFVSDTFVDGDQFDKAAADLAAYPPWASPRAVDNDWQFLWSLFGERAFCEEHWNQYVAVFMEEVVSSGPTDPAARDAAARALSERGTTGISPERFVVDFVGDT